MPRIKSIAFVVTVFAFVAGCGTTGASTSKRGHGIKGPYGNGHMGARPLESNQRQPEPRETLMDREREEQRSMEEAQREQREMEQQRQQEREDREADRAASPSADRCLSCP